MNDMSGFEATLIRLFDSAGYQVLAVLVALGVGAAHAVAPGHGKSITAAYLIGTQGRYRDAAFLGGVVAVMHTVSALVLSVAWVSFMAVSSMGTETVTGVLRVVAGVVIVCVGVHLAIRRRRYHHHGAVQSHLPGHGQGHPCSHSHDDHTSAGAVTSMMQVADEETSGSHHGPRGAATPWTRRGLLALGLSGGLLPSPSAFLVLVSGLLTGRLLFALLLVIVFGAGMAATLTGVGVLTLKGKALIDARSTSSVAFSQISAWIPIVAAYAVIVGGLIYLISALSTLA